MTDGTVPPSGGDGMDLMVCTRLSFRSAAGRRRCCSAWPTWYDTGAARPRPFGPFRFSCRSGGGRPRGSAPLPSPCSALMVYCLRSSSLPSCQSFDMHQVEVGSGGSFGFTASPQLSATRPPPPFLLVCRSTLPLFLLVAAVVGCWGVPLEDVVRQGT